MFYIAVQFFQCYQIGLVPESKPLDIVGGELST